MEPEGYLPYSQVPATCPYPQPTPSSPHNPRQLPKHPSYTILPSTSRSPQWPLSLRFHNYINIGFKELGWKCVNWLALAHTSAKWRDLVKAVLKLRVP
jgi:hypothetical protein